MDLTLQERNSKFFDLRAEVLKRFEGRNEFDQIVLFYFHDAFAALLTGPIENRIDAIIGYKPLERIPIHLKWIQPYIPGDPRMAEFDARCTRVHDKWATSAVSEQGKLFQEQCEALVAWSQAYEPIFLAAHSDCPWDGKTLFPNQE